MSLCRPVLPAVRAVHHLPRLLAFVLLSLTLATPALAQLSLPGGTRSVHHSSLGLPAGVLGVDAAYDPTRDQYLVVAGYGPVKGVCVDRNGNPVAAPFAIQSEGGFGSFPRVVYSREANGGQGAFLAAWTSQAASGSWFIKARLATCPGKALGTAERNISTPVTASGVVGTLDVGYSPTSQRFLIVWKAAQHTLYGRLVSIAGAPVDAGVPYTTTFAQYPAVAWNSARNEFGVSYSGESGSTVFSGFVRVSASNAAAFSRETFNIKPASAYLIAASDIAYNTRTGRYIMGWFEIGGGSRAAEISSAGDVLTTGLISNGGWVEHFSVDYNPVSGTSLYTTIDSRDNLLGGELNSRGYRYSSERILSQAHPPSFYMRVAPSNERAEWLVSFSGGVSGKAYSLLGLQPVVTAAQSGGPAGTLGSAGGTGGGTSTPTTPTSPTACPGSSPVSGWVCVSGSWLPPDHPLAKGSTPPPTTTPQPPPPTTSSPKCAGTAPVAGWVCVTGGSWVPADHPLAKTAGTGGSTGGGTTTPTAPTCGGLSSPGTGFVCVNNAWLPPGHPDIPAMPACTGSQLTGRPASGWYRLSSGDWVPESHPLAKQAVCRG